MAITGVQLVYRLKDTVRLLIDYRNGGTPPDSFNLYWSSTSAGVYTLFQTHILNQPSDVPSIKGRILTEFHPSQIVGWNNLQTNFLKMAPVTGGAIGALEGPMTIPTREEMFSWAEKSIIFGFDKVTQKFIPIAVDSTGKLL